MGRAEPFAHGVHVGDGIWGGAHAEAAGTGSHDGGFIISAHNPENDEVGKEGHHHRLDEEGDDERHCQVRQLPELQAHEGAGNKNIEAHAAKNFAFLLVNAVETGAFCYVPDDRCHNHGADVAREHQADIDKKLAHIGADAHGQKELAEGVHEIIHVEVIGSGVFIILCFRMGTHFAAGQGSIDDLSF